MLFKILRNHSLEESVLGLKLHAPDVPCWYKPAFKNGRTIIDFGQQKFEVPTMMRL